MLVTIVVAFVAVQHIGFAWLEMVLWKKPAGRKIFGMSESQAEETAVLALNQGLYNLFLAAGLLASFFVAPAAMRTFQWFFLGCVLVAGIVGGLTAKRTILFIQGGPALVGLVLLAVASS